MYCTIMIAPRLQRQCENLYHHAGLYDVCAFHLQCCLRCGVVLPIEADGSARPSAWGLMEILFRSGRLERRQQSDGWKSSVGASCIAIKDDDQNKRPKS